MTGTPLVRMRIFYFCSITTDNLNRKFDVQLNAGAATGKVMGICAALNSAGELPVIVSDLIPWRRRDITCTRHLRADGFPYAKLFTAGRGLPRRLLSSASYFWYAVRHVRRSDTVLLYNFFPDYIPAAAYLKLIGRPAVLDIEDAPNPEQSGLWKFVNPLFFRIMLQLCEKRYITVSRAIGRQYQLQHYMPIYGVSDSFQGAGDQTPRFTSPRIRILFGGAILPETGSGLFQDTVRLLGASYPNLPIDFLVTGQFAPTDMATLARDVEARSEIRIVALANLSRAEYSAIVRSVDAGLCLKLASTGMGKTTFPSKVIEYAALGLLVISTRVSDVPHIFDESNSALLDSESPETLAAVLAAIASDRAAAAERARAGQTLVLQKFSCKALGRELAAFIRD